jgi:hypothetical protein
MRTFAEKHLQRRSSQNSTRPATKSAARQTDAILHLHRTIGNRALIQAKLNVSSPEDAYEQEADRVAAQVMRMTGAQIQRACSCGGRVRST